VLHVADVLAIERDELRHWLGDVVAWVTGGGCGGAAEEVRADGGGVDFSLSVLMVANALDG